MRKFVFKLAFCLAFLASSPAVQAAELPKCRHVAGFESKPICEARNQRAQWQAEETARLTAYQIGLVLEHHKAREAQMSEAQDGFIASVKGLIDTVISSIKGLF
tara:strand:+ start:1148 stop:1459 length:312 start_codon:yes stop_codon:yes gene_type:complete